MDHRQNLVKASISPVIRTLTHIIVGQYNIQSDLNSKKMLIMHQNLSLLNMGSHSCKSLRKTIFKNLSLYP